MMAVKRISSLGHYLDSDAEHLKGNIQKYKEESEKEVMEARNNQIIFLQYITDTLNELRIRQLCITIITITQAKASNLQNLVSSLRRCQMNCTRRWPTLRWTRPRRTSSAGRS